MPVYTVTAKQGSRTITQDMEFKSVADCLAFFSEVTTMEVKKITKVEYENLKDDKQYPVDDMNYQALVRVMCKNDSLNFAQKIVVPHVKMSKSTTDIFNSIKAHCEIDGKRIDTYYPLF